MVDPARLPTSFEGVPLAQLAHVAAARAEGFSLAQILDAEGLAAEVFRAADVACKATLCDRGRRASALRRLRDRARAGRGAPRAPRSAARRGSRRVDPISRGLCGEQGAPRDARRARLVAARSRAARARVEEANRGRSRAFAARRNTRARKGRRFECRAAGRPRRAREARSFAPRAPIAHARAASRARARAAP